MLGIGLDDICVKSDKEIINFVKSTDQKIIDLYKNHFEEKRKHILEAM